MEGFLKISIVTPSFNQGSFIEQTITSVLNQGYPNLEYIIIDGGSTDNTVDIIKKYADRITYWISEPDKGQTDAINKGFQKCTGDIFNWLNSDDYYEPGVFDKLNSIYQQNKSAKIVCGKEWAFQNSNEEDRYLNPGSIIKEDVYYTIQTGIIDQPCTFFRRNDIEGFFPLSQELKYIMDRQLWWSFLLKYGQKDIIQVKDVFTNFRLHQESKSISQQSHFEGEFDRLKKTLFLKLNAPDILLKIYPESSYDINFKININGDLVLSAFATKISETYYISEDYNRAKPLMQFVFRHKKLLMNKLEWKLFIYTILPGKITKMMKRLKAQINK